MNRWAFLIVALGLIGTTAYADEPTRARRVATEAQPPRSIPATAARGIDLLEADDYEGFLRDLLPPADWRMLEGSEKLRAKIIRRLKAWDDELTAQLRNIQSREEGDLALNGDRTEAGSGFVEHLEDGKAVSHAIALRRLEGRWYLSWAQREQDIFVVWARDRERSSKNDTQ